MKVKPYFGSGFYVDPPSERLWQVCQLLEIPYVGGDESFGYMSPAKAVSSDNSTHEPSLPVSTPVTFREVAAHPSVIQQLCFGIIDWAYLKNSGDEFEIHALMKGIEQKYGTRLRKKFPKDKISGQCDLFGTDGSIADKALFDALGQDDWGVSHANDPVVRTMRSHATALFAWLASYLVRAVHWRPKPPVRIVLNQTKAGSPKNGAVFSGKQREVYDFCVPLDKVTMNALNLVLQALIPSQPNSHCTAQRGVYTAIEQVKDLLSQGYFWVQALDLRKAFPSVSRAVAMKRVKAIVAEQVMNSPDFVLGLPTKADRLAAAMRLIEATMDIPYAKDKVTGEKVDVSQVGLFQGSSLSGTYLNMCLDGLDRKFAPTALGDKDAVYVRYCDNFFVLAKSKQAAKAAYKRICTFCQGHLKVKVRRETNNFNLFNSYERVSFLGLSVGFNKSGNPDARLTSKGVERIGKALGALDSIAQIKRGVNVVFRHYARGQFLTDHVVKRLCGELQVALNTNFGGSNAQADDGCLSYKALLATRDAFIGKVYGKTGEESWEEELDEAICEVS